MKKATRRLVLDKQTVRDLTALDAAQVIGGATVNFCTILTVRVCPSRTCTIDPGCP